MKGSKIDIIIPIYERNEVTEKAIKLLEKYTSNYNLILIT